MSGLPEQNDAADPGVDDELSAAGASDIAADSGDSGEGEPAASAAEAAAGSSPQSSADDLADDGAVDDLLEDDEDDEFEDVDPIEEAKDDEEEGEITMQWYILKIQVNRETSICAALERRVKIGGLERYFGEILVPTEDVREFTKSGKQRTIKRKLYPGYIVVRMALNEETWFLVRETPGIGDFTGSAGKPAPLSQVEIDRIIRASKPEEVGEEAEVKIGIKFKVGERVRVKEGSFQNFEGEVESIDESNGRIVVVINIFNRATPVEMEHWEVESM